MRSLIAVLVLLCGLRLLPPTLRPTAAATAWSAAALREGDCGQSQEAARIEELLARLDDESIDVRSATAAALVELGKSALPALRRASGTAGVDLKDRLSDVIRKIQDRERLSALLPPPSRITIDAKNRPLREVLEKLSKQTTTPIDYSKVPEDALVTVTLDRVPLWKALDQICRASGKVMVDLEPDHIVINPEPYVCLPGKLTDQFCVTLQKVEVSTELVFGQQERYERFSAVFHVSWEKGARPYHVSAHIAELVDEAGNELVVAGEDLEPEMLSPIAPDQIFRDFTLPSPHGPGPGATKISRLKVEIEFEFPLKFAEVKIDLTGGKFPASANCTEFEARIARMDRVEGALTASLLIVPHGTLEGEITSDSVVLRDKNGKEYPVTVTEGSPAAENETPYQLIFATAPESLEFGALIIKVPTEVHRERLDIELKDLDLR